MNMNIISILLFSLFAASNVFAQDSNRINQLEQEIQNIKIRLSKLESLQGTQIDAPKSIANLDGWKSISSWRQLAKGMTPGDVRRVLGEPSRINGGEVAFWYYPNRGYVTFMSDKLYSWNEPN
jgi:hypothetical protein